MLALPPNMRHYRVAVSQSELCQVDLRLFEGEGEGFLTKSLASPAAQQAFEQILEFVHQHLG